MNKLNFLECQETTIALVMAILMYRDDAEEKIHELFKDIKSRIWTHHHGSHKHGLFFDEDRNRVFSIERGTSGNNLLGKLMSWGTDFRVISGKDEIHNGFENYGNRSFDLEKKHLENYHQIILGGHSQGSGTQQYKACLCCENLNMKSKHVNADLFAVPPASKGNGTKRIKNHIDSGKLSMELWNNPGDPIGSDVLRDEGSFLLNGEYPVKPNMLPDPITQDLGPLEVLAHSGRAYISTYNAFLGSVLNYEHCIDYILLGIAHRLAVN